MEIRQLKCFLAAYTYGSLASAATRLRTVQSNISMHIRHLEQEFGVSLCYRTGRGLVPTPAGERLYRLGSRLLHELNFAVNYARCGASEESTVLLVGTVIASPGSQLDMALSDAIEKTGKQYPSVNFRLFDYPHKAPPPAGSILADVLADEHAIVGRNLAIKDRWGLISLRGETELPDRELHYEKIAGAIRGLKLGLPRLPGPVMNKARRLAKASGIKIVAMPIGPDAIDARAFSSPQQVFLMPLSCIPGRTHQQRFQVTPIKAGPFDLAWTLKVATARCEQAAAESFFKNFRNSLRRGLPSLSRRRVNSSVKIRPERGTAIGEGRSRPMDLRDLRYFEAVYERGNVSRAAVDLRVSQPALSIRLKGLERKLRTKLFDRTAHGVVPTARGNLLHGLFEPILQDIAETREHIKELGRHNTTPIRVGVIPALDEGSLLAEALANSLSQWGLGRDSVELKVIEAYNIPLRRWTLQELLDFAIVDTITAQSGLVVTRLSCERMGLVSCPHHRLCPPGPICGADVVKLNLALPSTMHGLRGIIDAAFNEAGLALAPRFEVDSMAATLRLVRAGPWGTILPISSVYRHALDGSIQVNEIETPKIIRHLCLIRRVGYTLDQRSLHFVKTFSENVNVALGRIA
jgi:DNA-binding transcriptional LysR family regulator